MKTFKIGDIELVQKDFNALEILHRYQPLKLKLNKTKKEFYKDFGVDLSDYNQKYGKKLTQYVTALSQVTGEEKERISKLYIELLTKITNDVEVTYMLDLKSEAEATAVEYFLTDEKNLLELADIFLAGDYKEVDRIELLNIVRECQKDFFFWNPNEKRLKVKL